MYALYFTGLLIFVKCLAAPADKSEEIVVEVPYGKNAILACASNDDAHIFAFWELANDAVIGPGNDYNPKKYEYEILSGALTIRHVSSDQEGVYSCVSKALRDNYGVNVRRIRMVVKKDWGLLYETDSSVNFFRIVIALASVLMVAGGGYFVYRKWKRRHRLQSILEEDDDDDSGEEIFSAPGTSRASGNIVLDRSDKSLDESNFSTDFGSILNSASK